MATQETQKLGLHLPESGTAGWDVLTNRNWIKVDSLLSVCELQLSGGVRTLNSSECFGAFKLTGPATGPTTLNIPLTRRQISFVNQTGFDVFIGTVGEEQKDRVTLTNGENTTIMFDGFSKCVTGGNLSSSIPTPKTMNRVGCELFFTMGNQWYMRNLQGGSGINVTKEGENVKVSLSASDLTASGVTALRAALNITDSGYRVKTHSNDKGGFLAQKLNFAAPLKQSFIKSAGGMQMAVVMDCKLIPDGLGQSTALLGCDDNGRIVKVSPESVLENWNIILGDGGFNFGQGVVQQKITLEPLTEGTYNFDWPIAYMRVPDVWEQTSSDPDTVINIDSVSLNGVQVSIISTSGGTVSGCLFAIGET